MDNENRNETEIHCSIPMYILEFAQCVHVEYIIHCPKQSQLDSGDNCSTAMKLCEECKDDHEIMNEFFAGFYEDGKCLEDD